jgi:hypothetical protein
MNDADTDQLTDLFLGAMNSTMGPAAHRSTDQLTQVLTAMLGITSAADDPSPRHPLDQVTRSPSSTVRERNSLTSDCRADR